VTAYEGDEMVIYPYTPEVVEVAGLVCIQGADHTIDHLNIYPWSASL
jgi:P2-related tail formation protein